MRNDDLIQKLSTSVLKTNYRLESLFTAELHTLGGAFSKQSGLSVSLVFDIEVTCNLLMSAQARSIINLFIYLLSDCLAAHTHRKL